MVAYVASHSGANGSTAAELSALTRIAEIVATSPDIDAMLTRASTEIAALVCCDMCAFFLVHEGGQSLELLHYHGADEEIRNVAASARFEETTAAEAALTGAAAVRQADEYAPPIREALARMHIATVASVPVRFRSRIVAIMTVGFEKPRDATECCIELLLAVGAQAAAAIESHRLLADLRRRVSELTLLNDITVASAALDPALLVQSGLRQIAATFRADTGTAYLLEGTDLVQVTAFGMSEETKRRLARAAAVGLAGRALELRRPVHVPNLDADEPLQGWIRRAEDVRVAVGVPLLVKDRAPGAFVLGRRRDEPFSEADVRLLSIIGFQFGMVVENARLFADARRRVADLEAVNSLALRVFDATPGDAEALLAATTRELAQALSARSAVVLQLDGDGTTLRGVAAFGTPLPVPDLAIPLGRSQLARRVLETRQPALGTQLFDLASPGERVPPRLSLLLVPLKSRRAVRGIVAVADEPQRRFNDAEIALGMALASEAAMALENAELYADARRRVEELSLLNDVGRTITSSLELDRILAEGARAAYRLVGGASCHVLLLGADELRFAASTSGGELVRDVRISVNGPSFLAVAVRERRPVVVDDVGSAALETNLALAHGIRSLLAAPLLVREEPVGVIVVAERDARRRFSTAEIERVKAIANQLAIAIENARLYEDLRTSYADLAHAQDQLVHQERLAALGELAAVVAHEVRNPLAVIFNSLGALRRHVQPSGDAHMLFDIIGEEADRLNRIVGELLEFAKPSPPSIQPEPIERVIDDAVAAALSHEQRTLEVARDIPAGLAPVPLDAGLIRQAIVNVVTNALQAMPEGGTLTVRARVSEETAVIEIGDTGPGIPEEARHRIFEPFFTTKAAGTGLGLALVKRIVDDHQGRVEVRPGDGGGTVFAFHLPLTARKRPRIEPRRRMGRG